MLVRLSDHFDNKKIFKITIFPIIMMVFTSLYSIVDGIFISNFANQSSFAAVNLVMPFIMIVGTVGFMMGTGGMAYVSKALGEGDKEKANRSFSLIVYATIIIGIIVSIIGFFLIEPIVKAMGNINPDTSEEMVNEAILYGRILTSCQVFFMIQGLFQSFFLVAEKSKLGFIVTLASGITNMIFDFLFIGIFKWGVVGAALATIMGYLVAAIFSLLYFRFNKKLVIRLGKTKFNHKIILKSAYNGLSEFVNNVSMSVAAIVYNIQLLRLYGENGVSAYGIIMYVSFVFVAIFIGYSIGVSPVIGYNYGAANSKELKNVFKRSLIIILVAGVIMTIASELSAKLFSSIFSNGNEELLELSTLAMQIYSSAYVITGLSIFTSSFFTALNNGTVSATVSLFRTLVFQVLFVLILPLIFGNIGIWLSRPFTEVASLALSITFLIINKKKYNY